MIELTPDQVRAWRTRAQGLHERLPAEALSEAVQAVCGVQAQLSSAMMLALRARLSGLTKNDVKHVIERHQLTRTWSMRGTLHLMHTDDVRWLIALLGPTFVAKGTRRREELGLDETICAKGLNAIQAILNMDQPLTRGEIVKKLAGQGIELEQRSQAPIHLIGLAALKGIVCLGPERKNGESTFVLVDRWIDQQPITSSSAAALSELARRYLTGYGPAACNDFAGWSGLSLTNAKQAWAHLQERGELTEVRVEERVLWLLTSASNNLPDLGQLGGPDVRLLSAFDNYVLGYKHREHVVPVAHQPEVYHGGQTVPVVLVNGLARGVWRYKRQGKRLDFIIKPFGFFDEGIQQLIAKEAEDIARFMQEFTTTSISYSETAL
jgi:Winged helix DNA-binding domain